jgi:hypothetical protein
VPRGWPGERRKTHFGKGETRLHLEKGSADEIAKHLRIQLFSPHTRGYFHLVPRTNLHSWELPQGIWPTVTISHGDVLQTVPRDQGFGLSSEELRAIALEQTLALGFAAECISPGLWHLRADHPFVAARASSPARLLEVLPTSDASYVSLPTWRDLLISTEASLQEHRELCAKLFELPDRLSPEIFAVSENGLAPLH